jgi:hypothetical protein
MKLLEVDNRMWESRFIKNYRSDKIDDYIDNIKKGKIRVPNADYFVLLGNSGFPIKLGDLLIRTECCNATYRLEAQDDMLLVELKNHNLLPDLQKMIIDIHN